MDSKTTIRSYNHKTIFMQPIEKLSNYIVDPDIMEQYRKFSYVTFGIIDRTGGMKHFLNVSYKDKIPKYNDLYSKKFADVCLERAKSIIDKKKELYILWSGGLDSTTILTSLIASDVDRNQVIICMTPDSLLESGKLYDNVIKKYFKRYILTNPPFEQIWKFIPKDCILVHGMQGDAVMGVEPYHVQEFMIDLPYEKHVYDDLINFYMPAIKRYPKKIITLKDFWNFQSFNLFWNANYYHFIRELSDTEKIESFYGHAEFQNWHISKKEYSYKKNLMRKFILDVLGNQAKEYVINKKIRYSYIRNEQDWLMYTSDNKTITSKDI